MEKQNVSSHISHLSTQFYKTKNIFVSFFKKWRIHFLDERYMCFSMKIEKHMRTLSDQKCSQWTHETMGKYRVKALLVSRWVPKFPGVQINKWMKQDFVNLVKKWWNILQDFPGQWAILSECNQYNLAISFL